MRCPVECAASPTTNYSHNQDDYHDDDYDDYHNQDDYHDDDHDDDHDDYHNQDDYHDEHDHDFDVYDVGDNMNDY